jgi:hypothetical protein
MPRDRATDATDVGAKQVPDGLQEVFNYATFIDHPDHIDASTCFAPAQRSAHDD